MNGAEVLRMADQSALSLRQFDNKVVGKVAQTKGAGKLGGLFKAKGLAATGLVTLMIVVLAVVFGVGNWMPTTFYERLIEATDVQYTDAVESKIIAFQQALREGDVPDDTAEILKANGVETGYVKDGAFQEASKPEERTALKIGDKVISADEFFTEVNQNPELYAALDAATYKRAAYYYDETGNEVFRKIGTNRNNFTAEADFDEVMQAKMGEGSDIAVGNVAIEKTEDGNEEYVEKTASTNGDANADDFVEEVRKNTTAKTAEDAALNSADALKVADTTSKEQRSSLFFALLMENISKMKYGDGNDSKINEMMNYLYEESESEVVDVNTGELVSVKGSAMESDSLYAVLAGEKIDPTKVQNYSSDRILKTVENQVAKTGDAAVDGTIASTDDKVKGSIGRWLSDGVEAASAAIVKMVAPTISNSLIDNSYASIKGVKAGEFLVEGAVNTGKMLAKAGGASSGDAEAVAQYARLNSAVLAMEARVDRMQRSPFDISSKNTFLGSIVYRFAINSKFFGGSLMGKISTVLGATTGALGKILPGVYADAEEGYLTSFGDCETIGTIGAVGSPQCSEVATFDTSTLDDPFNNPEFKAFVEANTTLTDGVRTINEHSTLADYIIYNDERITPLGVMDGGILSSLSEGSTSTSFVSSILAMIERLFGASDQDKRIANGAAFVNSSSNPDWKTYKYAQRYVALARATAALKQHSSDSTAYSKMPMFEGAENPVVAFTRNYYAKLDSENSGYN